MKNLKKLLLATVLTLGLGALAAGAYASLDDGSTQIVDTSGQPNEWDVG